ncbi:sterigmatocystin 8-O-methyltransferase precursor [Lecanosticta acicola]|uniref:Sterigmatocystin 8-O-methyltransferase n=1 Tax=Lecanosticta acicola TaxID=111012 RepID=A0AAI8YRH9_9PEZI|nr:sterigmatocystin 8-O-methyltransferase precursor [Lecanosticta acicola]
MTAPKVDTTYLTEQLKLLVRSPEAIVDDGDDAQRSELQRLTRQASIALETSQESMQRVMFSHLPLVTTRLSNSFGIFAPLAKASLANPVPLEELVKASGLNRPLVRSIMDYNVYHGAAVEPQQYFYAPTKLTHSLLDPKSDVTTTCWHELVGPAYGKLHQLLKHGAGAGKRTAFQVAHDTTETFYDFLESRPEKHSIFYGYMAANHSVTAKWTNVVRFDEELAAGAKKDETVFVDIGGGDGGQSIEAQKVHKLGGKIVLQDRSAVIAKAAKAREAGIETMDYDFFTEQPIKGARVYFIQFVLLNWDDEAVVKILSSQVPAMGPDSLLVIVDFVQCHRWVNLKEDGSPQEPDLWTPSTAIAAYSCHESKGRAREDYGALLERAGLELKETRIYTGAGQGVMIAKKKL